MRNKNLQTLALLKSISVNEKYVDVEALGRQLETFADYEKQISKLNLVGIEPLFSIQQKGSRK